MQKRRLRSTVSKHHVAQSSAITDQSNSEMHFFPDFSIEPLTLHTIRLLR